MDLINYEIATAAARLQRVAKRIHAPATCGGCGRTITGDRYWTQAGGHSCAACHAAHVRTSTRVVERATPAAPIAMLEGVALSFAVGCGIPARDGSFLRQERFHADSLDASLARGGQVLTVDHHIRQPLRGAFTRLLNDGGELRFRFTLFDGAAERRVLAQIQDRTITACSVGFTARRSRFVDHLEEYLDADLLEVSLVSRGRPAWFGTSVRATV